MFYYPQVLKRHTGCFSTIWLVATKGIRVPRRDFLKVNVKSTCDDIMNYVLEQVPPPLPGLPRPRFSLYLSSQLQYGVVVVYHRQCVILLEELQSMVGQLVKQRTSQQIDMDVQSRQAPVLPDALSLQEEAEGAPDPFFGLMHLQEPMPSPGTLAEMSREYQREESPEHPEATSPASTAAAADADADAAAAAAASPVSLESSITASPDTITLRETEPVAIPVAEFEGEELAMQHPDIVDFLLAQTDHFPEGDVEPPRQEEVAPSEPEREPEMERGEHDLGQEEGTRELPGSTLELQPTATSAEDATLLPQEESGLPTERPGPPTDQLTPVSVPGLPSPPSVAEERQRRLRDLELEDIPPPQPRTRRRRRRQLIFFDPETQLSQEALQEQIDNPLTETRRPPLTLPPSRRLPPAADLFNNPCNSLPEEIESLWRPAATITPLSGSDLQPGDRGPESTDSERDGQPETVEEAEREEERLGLSPQEVQREMAEEEMFHDISAHGTLPLEVSDQREASREISPMPTSEREGSIVSRSVSTLPDIPEVLDELPGQAPSETPETLPELDEGETPPVIFQSLLPPDADSRTVSNIFQKLLGERLPLRSSSLRPISHVEIVLMLKHQHRRKLLNQYSVYRPGRCARSRTYLMATSSYFLVPTLKN
ncbi:meiotic recombination protein REC8 homolog isoform X2 [Mugil cephalus]|uniref:meiotic recombination protein REC8 homolog isoform X2 n=1 Tax=Mugil cephalus TaxID=48193 RepID=UPI001FB608B9|nr:meiotic recombination protein REC8 homolog isoform X2 [Mugil cephalus]